MTHTHKTYQAAILQTAAHRVLRNQVVETLEKFDLTVPEWTILGHVHHEESLRFVDIAELLNVEPPHVTTLIDILQKKKLAVRKDDLKDRRAKRIFLTKKAQDLIPEVEIELSAQMNLLLENISIEEMRVYFKILQSIISNGEKILENRQVRVSKSQNLTISNSKN